MIAAAGSGERAGEGDGSPKQFREIGGRPMLTHSIEAFRRAGCGSIVVVLPPGKMDLFRDIAEGTVLTEGGDTRQRSVANGLDEITSEFVLVHDAARPLVSVALIERVIAALADNDAVVPGLPVAETLKSGADGYVTGTVDREGLWAIQTPQGFRTSTLRKAHDEARTDPVGATDDAALVERLGGKVALVPGQRTNIKVTLPDDFRLAASLLGGEAS